MYFELSKKARILLKINVRVFMTFQAFAFCLITVHEETYAFFFHNEFSFVVI